MDDVDPVNIAKTYMDENFPHMTDGVYSVNTHNPQHDLHLVQHLDGVEESHLDEDPYHVVTVSKDVTLEGGISIPTTVKLKVKDDEVSGVLMSKSFDASPVL